MRVNVGVSSWRTKRGSKGSCCFFRGAKGPLNPSLYPAAAMPSAAARLNASFPSHQVAHKMRQENGPNGHLPMSPVERLKIGVVNNARVPLSHNPKLVLGFKIALFRESADLRMHKRRQNTRTHEFPVWVSGSFCVVEKKNKRHEGDKYKRNLKLTTLFPPFTRHN